MNTHPNRDFVTPRELADRWHISEKTLERWRMQGTGPVFLKLGGRVLYRIEQVEAHERNRSRTCTSKSLPYGRDHNDSDHQVVSAC
ncbi:MAG: helix-turn-helix domain-containing protein [Betaproteobacteria bacterium]|nr:helix-turn-helix domain-containing protein [Betaproteobacteria bacterium]